MTRLFMLVGVGVALAAATGGTTLRAQNPADVLSITLKGVMPGSSVSVALTGSESGSASTTGTAGPSGLLDLVLGIANRGKIVTQIEVYVDDCDTTPPSTKVYLVQVGQQPPSDTCRRRKIGAFWLNKTRHLTIQGNRLSTGGLSRTQWMLIGGGGAGAAIVALTAGGETTRGGGPAAIVTNGIYAVVFAVSNDPNGSAPFVLYQLITQLVVNGTGSTAQITGNQAWQPGNASVAGGVLSFDFCGTVAQRTGVRIRGTLTVTPSGAISGTVTVGEAGGCATQTLPGNPPQIVYTVTGQRVPS